MSAAVVPWAITREERRIRRALRRLSPEDRALCEAVAAPGAPPAYRDVEAMPTAQRRALTALRTAYLAEG